MCVCAFDHCIGKIMFKYSGLFTAQERRKGVASPMGSLYFGHVLMQPFNPLAALELFCPIRRKAWALSTPVFDYRVAQNSGALEPRDGRWYSRSLEILDGECERVWPMLGAYPEAIDCTARVSWWPPHATIIWQGGTFYQKLSFRPVTDAPCDWKEIIYDDSWVAADMIARFPEVFTPELVRVAETAPPRPGTENSTSPPETSTTQDTAKALNQDKAPNAEKLPPPVKESTVPKNATSVETPPDEYQDWSTASDSNEWVWNSPRRPNSGWDDGNWGQANRLWEPAYSWAPNDWSPNEWSPNVWTPGDETPPEITQEKSPVEAAQNSPPRTPSTSLDDVPLADSPLPDTGAALASVTVQETLHTVRTRSVETTATVTASESMEAMLALQTMALRGAPLDRQDRLNRQHLASSLRLPPEIYNYLVFGERVEDTEALADAQPVMVALPPPSP